MTNNIIYKVQTCNGNPEVIKTINGIAKEIVIGENTVITLKSAKEAAKALNDRQAALLVNKGDTITIIGRRWFDKINGNTYFSAIALINGKEVANIPYEYGYGNQYEDSMFNKLVGLGYCADREKYNNGGNEAFWVYCNRKGVTKYVTHSDVSRKKYL